MEHWIKYRLNEVNDKCPLAIRVYYSYPRVTAYYLGLNIGEL